jgi:hypothetical protein
VPENYRVTHQFLHKEGWLEHLVDKSPEILKRLVEIKIDDPQLPRLAKHIEAFLTHHQESLADRYSVMRFISTKPR